MPKCLAKIIDWQKFHITPEIKISINNLRIFPYFFRDFSKDPFVKVTKLIIQDREKDAIKTILLDRSQFISGNNIYVDGVLFNLYPDQV